MSTSGLKTVENKTSGTGTINPPKKIRRVRNREHEVLEGSITTEKDFVRFALEPNVWQEVPEIVFQHLKNKFGTPKDPYYVLDHRANEASPHGPGELPKMRKEYRSSYIIEGLDQE